MVAKKIIVFLFAILIAIVTVAVAVVDGQYTACPSATYTDSYSSLPAGATFPSTVLASTRVPTGRPITQNHYSETANYAAYRPAKITPSANPALTNCPHLQTGLVNWHNPAVWGGSVPGNGSNVNIPANTKVLISSCSFDPSFVFGTITVPAGSALIIGDAPISIQAKGFSVAGSLQAGSPTCRLRNKVSITLHGSRGAQALPAASSVKGIAVTGSVDIHGMQYFPTWTRLAMTAEAGDTIIFMQDIVNWQVGQTIYITSTELKDARDWHRNEVKTIKNIFKATSVGANVAAIELDSALSYRHYGGPEYQAEVGLQSRNIIIQGDRFNSDPTDVTTPVCTDTVGGTQSTYPCPNQYLTGFGGHVQVIGSSASGRFSGIELYRMGQTNVLGRYPLHFHMIGTTTPDRNYATDCSVHQSFFRCYTIHGTHGVLLSQNTAYDAIGNCYYVTEDGIEENNTISHNLAAHVHAIGPVQDPSLGTSGNGWWGQYLSWYNQNANLLVPADMSAAGFYVTNCYSTIEGNAASGGWAGFSFPSLPLPIGDFKTTTNFSPQGRPFKTPFRGNTAHSSGFWWGSASAFYFGGQLEYTDASKTTLTYTAGRSGKTHDTCSDTTSGTSAGEGGCWTIEEKLWLDMQDNKAFLSNRGLQQWGNRANIQRFEIHDTVLSMNVFGEIWIDNLLMNCRSANLPTWFAGCPAAPAKGPSPPWGACNIRDFYFFRGLGGFQWYDVSQVHILTNSTFRNCRNDWQHCIYGSTAGVCDGSAVFTSLSHSDQFNPQLMQITNKIKYENSNNIWQFSTALTAPEGITVSGRMQNWIDADGSASGKTQRTMIGSTRAGQWWQMNSLCSITLERNVCPMAPLDGAAAMKFHHNPSQEAGVGSSLCLNGNWDGTVSCPIVGKVTHFGRAESTGVDLAVMPQVSGPFIYKSGGWFVRFASGTPATLSIAEIQLSNTSLPLVIGIPYPAGTTFSINFQAASWCSPTWGVCTHPFRSVASVSAVISGFGDVYFWDTSRNILFVKPTMQRSFFGNLGTDAPWTSIPPPQDSFTRAGQTINIIAADAYIEIKATNCGGTNCAAQPNTAVPAALNPSYVDNVPIGGASATPSATPSRSVTPSPSRTAAASPSRSATASPSRTPSATASRSVTASRSITASPSRTPSATASRSVSASRSITASPSRTPSATASRSVSASRSKTASPSRTASATASRSVSASRSKTASPSVTPSRSRSKSPSVTPSRSASRSVSASRSKSPSLSASRSKSRSPSPK